MSAWGSPRTFTFGSQVWRGGDVVSIELRPDGTGVGRVLQMDGEAVSADRAIERRLRDDADLVMRVCSGLPPPPVDR